MTKNCKKITITYINGGIDIIKNVNERIKKDFREQNKKYIK